MILTLYDRQHIKLRPLHQIKDLHIDSVLSTGDKTLSFLMPGSQLRDVYTEAYISTPNDDFVIKSITPSSNGWYQIQCSLNVEELESYMDSFESVEKTMKECLDYAFLGTGWHVGICEIKKKRTIRRTNTTPWKIMQDARKTYRAEIKINSKDKVVDIYEHIGSDKGVYFAEQLNLKQLNKQVTSYDFYTQIKPIGANGLTIESVNDGDPILSNHTYSKKDKLYIWTDQRYTVAENLKADAQAKLDEMSTPLNAYSLQIIDLAKISDDYVDILSFGLGDTVTLMHESTNTFEKTRIVSLVEYPDEPNKNKCEVANSILKFEDIQQEMRDASDTINNVTTDNGTLDGSKVDSITTSQISDFDVQVQKVVDFTAIRAEIDDLRVKSATIQDLAAALARIGTLEATSVTTITLNAEIAKLNQAIIGKADITDLTSISGKITVLESSVATLDTIVNRVTTSDSIHSLVINASTAVIDNAFLKSIVSSNITVNDLLAGDISTTRFKVKSDSGNLSITDNTIQISDTNRVRVQVGKDASGDYNMYVWDKSGNLMFDATGITAKGIQRPIIVNDMVSDNANISGDKINITSVIQKINANSTLIESSHILYDGKSLDVAFGKMETSVSTVTSNVNTVTKTVTDNKTKWDTASTNATNALNTANTVTKTVSDNKSNWDKAPTALTNANNAQNTANNAQSVANSKAKVFSAQPTPPYQVGDLWVQGTSGVIMRCKTARASG
ncbi:phage tail protein, partial [Absiella sp. AM27-20]|uniref:phage tail protein n=1 Tax=Absiella sp. AM27-20 TaxID=2292277 RepID=UPI000FF6D20C